MSIANLADRAGLSKRSLQRKFTNNTGYTVSQYCQELRIEKAKGLLELSRMPVSEICWEVGYQDVAAFSRLFKSISGLSASEYRRRFSVQ